MSRSDLERIARLEAALRHVVVVAGLAKWNMDARLTEIRRKAQTALGTEYDQVSHFDLTNDRTER